MNGNGVVLLLVEDNPGDVVLFAEALEHVTSPPHLRVAMDAAEALTYLRRAMQGDREWPAPDAVVLDLNLPVKTGREMLIEMREDPSLCKVPVAVLSSARHESSVCSLYTTGRCEFFAKTHSFTELVKTVRRIIDFAQGA